MQLNIDVELYVCLCDGKILLYVEEETDPRIEIDLLTAVEQEVLCYAVPATCRNPQEGVLRDKGAIEELREKLLEAVAYIDSWRDDADESD